MFPLGNSSVRDCNAVTLRLSRRYTSSGAVMLCGILQCDRGVRMMMKSSKWHHSAAQSIGITTGRTLESRDEKFSIKAAALRGGY